MEFVTLSYNFIDKNNILPQGLEIGYHPEEDRKRFTVTPRGIVVVPKGYFGKD